MKHAFFTILAALLAIGQVQADPPSKAKAALALAAVAQQERQPVKAEVSRTAPPFLRVDTIPATTARYAEPSRGSSPATLGAGNTITAAHLTGRSGVTDDCPTGG